MIQSPKSLTATIHVRFHYSEPETKETKSNQGQVEIMAQILDRASELDPDLQEMLVKFADYLNRLGKTEEGG